MAVNLYVNPSSAALVRSIKAHVNEAAALIDRAEDVRRNGDRNAILSPVSLGEQAVRQAISAIRKAEKRAEAPATKMSEEVTQSAIAILNQILVWAKDHGVDSIVDIATGNAYSRQHAQRFVTVEEPAALPIPEIPLPEPTVADEVPAAQYKIGDTVRYRLGHGGKTMYVVGVLDNSVKVDHPESGRTWVSAHTIEHVPNESDTELRRITKALEARDPMWAKIDHSYFSETGILTVRYQSPAYMFNAVFRDNNLLEANLMRRTNGNKEISLDIERVLHWF